MRISKFFLLCAYADNSNDDYNSSYTGAQIDAAIQKAQNSIQDKAAFTEAATRANIASGETYVTILGKIKKWFTDLATHLADTVLHLTSTERYTQMTYYGTCETAAGTAAKVVTCVALTGVTPVAGMKLRVKFSATNSASSPTLKISSSGTAYYIKKYGTTAPDTYMWYAGAIVEFTFDGTNWIMSNGTVATTTYEGVVKLSSSTSSTSTATAATSSAVKAAYDAASGKATKVLYIATVATGSWTSLDDGGFKKTVTVSGVLATDTPVVGLVLTGDSETDAALTEEWPLVSRMTTAANSVTLYCYGSSVPSVALPLQLLCVR